MAASLTAVIVVDAAVNLLSQSLNRPRRRLRGTKRENSPKRQQKITRLRSSPSSKSNKSSLNSRNKRLSPDLRARLKTKLPVEVARRSSVATVPITGEAAAATKAAVKAAHLKLNKET